jgi:ABC-type Fe3+-siderophore transport system permease subunit
LVLVSLGVAIVLLEQAFRWPLQLPGHHGLEAMALLVLGRLSCTTPWSATLVGASAAAAAPFVGADHGVLTPLFYVLPGVVLDAGYRLWPRLAGRFLLFLPLLAALAFTAKPVLRVLANQLFGMEFGSLRAGPVYPILTHLMFGFLGALAAVLVWRVTEDRLRR